METNQSVDIEFLEPNLVDFVGIFPKKGLHERLVCGSQLMNIHGEEVL
ncbi:MAG: hypothetical protein KC917_03115 [Candidatus Omnitrophica bacterium]|nr:hypothetical protein [Candidatus Omnitrophota bacterium]MCA9423764.1 hypothetical protein [Candidatus Omnitrophota bacterium]MCA9435236.1 hypothetical protein [Candidatus Omnitrophota bacterium]